MANGTRSSRKLMDDEHKRFIGIYSSSGSKGSAPLDSLTKDSSGLRRSSRTTSSKEKASPCPSSSTSKSAPISLFVTKRKVERVNKQITPSSLRRSMRGKEDLNTSSCSDKNSPISLIKTRKKETRVRKLSMESKELNKEEKNDSEHAHVENKGVDSRIYKKFFTEQKKRCNASDPNEQLHNQNKLPKSNSITKTVEADCSVAETLQRQELLEFMSIETSLDCIDLVHEDMENPLKRKRDGEEMDCEDSVASEDTDLSCVTCSKKQRLYATLPRQELCCSCDKRIGQEICGTSTPKGRGEEIILSLTTSFSPKPHTNPQKVEPHVDMQTDADENLCFLCNLGGKGKLLCCDGKGCKKIYHLSCLNRPLEEFTLGTWHCFMCVKKKMKSGVISVSEGIESIWDFREVKVSDLIGSQKEKQYLVKYKGLAHVHNSWIPESQLLLEAPSMIADFNINPQVRKLENEWTMPHRLLKKRLIALPIHCSDEQLDMNTVDSHYEWLVKWRGLGYEHATWELSNCSIFNSPIAESLVKEYGNRHEKAKHASTLSNVDKIMESKKGPLTNFVKLPIGASSGIDCNHLISINKLREYWHMGQNAVVFDDLERITKVISFILSLQSDTCHPFLIISTSSTLSVWESKFHRLAPTIDVVVYSGSKDIRRSIRKLELYEEGLITFQVLLSPPEAIVEDLESFKCIGWEAIIFDDGLNPNISTHIEQIKMLATGFSLFHVFGPLKDIATEYLNMLFFLDNGGDSNISSDDISNLKEKLSSHIAYECKSDTSSRFAEYWVPVQISDLQLEQYCSTLLSNSMLLRSCTNIDLMGGLRDLLLSLRKCCDHPYLLDPSLQTLMIKDLPVVKFLDVGIKASGKMEVLDNMLSEIKKQGLKVLVLFQAIGGYGPNSIGNYLDDFLFQRFGPDFYERIDRGGVVYTKKQAAMNKFNNEKGRFIFLLENRACLQSIKLSSVDCIIMFDSDWNPINDLRALQKITISSKSHPIKIFRLYSSCTVEEKALIFAKQDTDLDNIIENVNSANRQMLLMWGASCLFNKCDEFHKDSNHTNLTKSNTSSEENFMKDLIQEFKILLSGDGGKSDLDNSSKILKVQQNGGGYFGNGLLLGEHDDHFKEEELLTLHDFWTKLLENKQPRWKFLSRSSQRNRKRVQYDENLSKDQVPSDEVVQKRKMNPEVAIDDSVKKHEIVVFLAACKPRVEDGKKVASGNKGTQANKAICMKDTLHENHTSTSPLRNNGISPEPEAHLNESEEIKKRRDAQKDLHLLLKPEIFKLCDILKLKDDVKTMARNILKYIMDNHQVDTGSTTILQAFQLSLCWIAASLLKQNMDKKASLEVAKQHLNFGCKEEQVNCIFTILLKKLKSSGYNIESDSSLKPVLATDDEDNKEKVGPKLKYKAIKRVEKKSRKRMLSLLQKQYEEERDFKKIYEEKKSEMEKEYQVELAIVRSIHSHHPPVMDKLKKLEETYEKKLNEHKLEMEMHLENLRKKHDDARKEEVGIKARLLEEVNSWTQVDDDGLENFSFRCDHNSEPQLVDRDLLLEEGEIAPDLLEIASDQVAEAAHSDREQDGQAVLYSPLLQQLPDQLNTVVQLRDEWSQLSTSKGNDALADKNHSNSQEVEECDLIANVSSNNHEASVVPNDAPENKEDSSSQEVEAVQCDLIATVSSDVHEAPVVPVVQSNGAPFIEPSSCNQNPAEITHQATTPSNQQGPVIECAGQLQSNNHPSLPSTSEIEPTVSVNNINQNSIQSSALNSPVNTISGGTPLSRTRTLPVISGLDTRSIQNASTISLMASQVMNQHMGSDPLQNESERIRKEMEQIAKIHEETKIRLKSDCEKEIEETVAEIRKKYEIIIEDNEKQFLLKKQELDAYHNKVYMNKMLAEAYRSKCVALRVAGKQGVVQPQGQLSMQQPRPRPSNIAGSSPTSLSAPRPRTLPPPRPVHAMSSPTGPPVHNTAPPQSTPHRPAHAMSSPMGPPVHNTAPPQSTPPRPAHSMSSPMGPPVHNAAPPQSTPPKPVHAMSSPMGPPVYSAAPPRPSPTRSSLAGPPAHNTAPPQSVPPRPAHAMSSPIGPPVHNAAPPRPAHAMSSPMGPPIQNATPAQTTSPHVSSLSVSNSTRPLHISTTMPSTGIRSPAPHLQHHQPSPVNNPSPLSRASYPLPRPNGALVSATQVQDFVSSKNNQCSECVMNYTEIFTTSQVFSRVKLIEWAQNLGKANDMIIVIIQSSKGRDGRKPRLTLGCERYGVYKPSKRSITIIDKDKMRETRTKKCKCPFILKGIPLNDNRWNVEVVCGFHNHPMLKSMEGHSI